MQSSRPVLLTLSKASSSFGHASTSECRLLEKLLEIRSCNYGPSHLQCRSRLAMVSMRNSLDCPRSGRGTRTRRALSCTDPVRKADGKNLDGAGPEPESDSRGRCVGSSEMAGGTDWSDPFVACGEGSTDFRKISEQPASWHLLVGLYPWLIVSPMRS